MVKKILFLIIVMGLFLFTSCLYYDNASEFCRQLGYNKATDIYDHEPFLIGSAQIECDREIVFSVCEQNICVRWDKWGECRDYDVEFERSSSITINGMGWC